MLLSKSLFGRVRVNLAMERKQAKPFTGLSVRFHLLAPTNG